MLTCISDILLFRLDFRDSDPQIIDLSPEKGVVASLKESRVECLSAEKVRLHSLKIAHRLTFTRTYTYTISCFDTLVDRSSFCLRLTESDD
jgi:hypothetical protein